MTGIVGSAIARAIRRDRGVRLLKVASIASIAVLVALAAVMAVDASLTILDPRVRWAMSLGILAVAILSGFLATLYMRRHRQSPRSMAKMLDLRHPEFQERLSTMVELSGRENAGFSRELFDVVCRRAADDAGAVVPEKEFPFGGAIRIGCVLLAMLLALLVSVVAAPSFAGRLLVRAVAPWADVGNVHSGDIEVKPGDVVALAGDVIRIEAKLKDSTVGRTRIRISRKTLLGWTEEAAEVALRYGAFIQNIITFLFQALVIFLFVKAVNKVKEAANAKALAEAAAKEAEDAAAAEAAEEEAKAKAEEEAAAAKEARLNDPGVQMLMEIRDLLKKQQ